MFSSSIWRTVSAQPLPSNIIRLRNILFFDGWLILAVDLFNAYLHSVQPRLQGNVGVERDWLVLVLAASVTLNLGNSWLCKELLLISATLYFCILPAYTPAILYLRYSPSAGGSLFFVWWYASITIFQLITGATLFYHYANLKSELDRRERELNLKEDQHLFVQKANLLTAQPCGHLLTDGDLSGVVNRLRHPHDVDLRANILCPKC